MFDIDGFITACKAALTETEPRLAIKEVLTRAVSDPTSVAAALPPARAEIVPLYVSDELSVLQATWAPRMSFGPHNHLMWAAIGLYVGQEDNAFYRRYGAGLVPSGGKELREREVVLLGADTIHSVTNPRPIFTGAIHVYGGDITARSGRSEWDRETFEERPYDFERTKQVFEDANQAIATQDT